MNVEECMVNRRRFILLLVLVIGGAKGSSFMEHDYLHGRDLQDTWESDAKRGGSFLGIDPPECSKKHSSKYDPLACWLWNLKIIIPDQEFQKSLFKVNVQGLSCSNFVVQRLNSTFIPSQNLQREIVPTIIKSPSINLTVHGISATCTGTYHAYPGGLSGGLQVITAETQDNNPTKRALQLTWEISSRYNTTSTSAFPTSQEYWAPYALTTKQCQASLEVSSLHFSGTISSRFIQMFAGVIGDGVSSQLNGQLCPLLKESVDPIVTQSIQLVVRNLFKFLPTNTTNNSSATITAETSRTVDFVVRPDQHLKLLPPPLSSSFSPSSLSTPQWLQFPSSVDFAKDTPLLINLLKKLNHFLLCVYEYTTDNSTTAITSVRQPVNCGNLITKSVKGLAAALLGSLATEVSIPIPNVMRNIPIVFPQYGRVLVDVQALSVMGLDQLQNLTLFSPIIMGDRSISQFHNRLEAGSAGLNVTATLNITVFAIPGGLIHGDPLNEIFRLDFYLAKADALAIGSLVLERTRFQSIRMGKILDVFSGLIHPGSTNNNSSEDLRCLLETVQTLQVDGMDLQAVMESATFVPHFDDSNFDHRRSLSLLVSRKLEEDLDEVMNNFLMLLLREYQPLLTDATGGLVRTSLRSSLNEWIDQKLHNISRNENATLRMPIVGATHMSNYSKQGQCRSNDDGSDKQSLANFSTMHYLETLNTFMNEPTSLDSVNDAIERFAAELEARYSPPLWANNVTTRLLKISKGVPGISLHLNALHIEKVGCVDHIDLLSPQGDGLHLRNGFSFGLNGRSPLMHVSLELDYRPRKLIGILNLTIALGDIVLDGGSLLHFDMTRLRHLSLTQLLSNFHCILSPFKLHQIYNNKNVSRIGALAANVSAKVTGGVSFDNFTVSTDTIARPSAVWLVDSVVAWVLQTLQRALNSAAHSSFEQAEGYCTGGQKFGFDNFPPILNDGFRDKSLLPVLAIFAVLLLGAQGAFFGYRRHVASQSSSSRRSFELTAEISQPLITKSGVNGSVMEFHEKADSEMYGETLLQSTVLSAFSRHAVPIFIIATITLLLSSNISSGATVDMYLDWGEKSLAFPALFTFSLVNTARDMWEAKIFPLFFFVLILSGCWPYTKLLLMFGSWLTPPNYLKPGTRGRLLLALDSLGKFALVDTYLFVLMMVAFRYHLDLSDSVSMDVFVSPETGFYTFLAATCFSLLLGHFMVYSHRLSEMRHFKPRETPPIRESAFGHKYTVENADGGNEAHQVKLSQWFRSALVIASLLVTVLLSVGITQKCFKFVIGGIAGDFLGDDRTTFYSVLSLGGSIRSSVKDPSIGVLVLEIIYFFYAVAMPFICLGVLLILALVPLTLQSQQFLLAWAEIANAWSAVEVFVISIIASLLEISAFASFIVGHRCDLIKEIIHNYFASALTDLADATCFTVRSSVEPSALFLILGALINSWLVAVLLRLIHCSVNDRIQFEMESSLEPTVDDALRDDSSSKPVTIISILSWDCWRRLFFDFLERPPRTIGYIPQSADTFSIAPEVNWEEDESPQHHTDFRPYASPSRGVMDTLRDAFG